MACGPDSAQCRLLYLSSGTALPVCLHVVCLLGARMAELSSCNRDFMTHKAQNVSGLALYSRGVKLFFSGATSAQLG